eukprot:277876_1
MRLLSPSLFGTPIVPSRPKQPRHSSLFKLSRNEPKPNNVANKSQHNLTSILFPADNSKNDRRMSRLSQHSNNNNANTVSDFVSLINVLKQQKLDEQNSQDDDCVLEEYSLCFFHRDTRFRQYLHEHIVNHKYFDRLVLFVISLNIIFLSLDDPSQTASTSNLQFAVQVAEIICTSFYVIETCLKVLTYGLVIDKHSYLR